MWRAYEFVLSTSLMVVWPTLRFRINYLIVKSTMRIQRRRGVQHGAF